MLFLVDYKRFQEISLTYPAPYFKEFEVTFKRRMIMKLVDWI